VSTVGEAIPHADLAIGCLIDLQHMLATALECERFDGEIEITGTSTPCFTVVLDFSPAVWICTSFCPASQAPSRVPWTSRGIADNAIGLHGRVRNQRWGRCSEDNGDSASRCHIFETRSARKALVVLLVSVFLFLHG